MAVREGDRVATASVRWWGLIALSICVLAVGIDLTVLNVALPTLAGVLHASTNELQWFVDAYSLVLSAALLPAGVLGDRHGRKRVLIVGLVVFGASSAVCASASSSGMLIAARALLGLGAAIIIPLSLSVLAVMFPKDEERQKAVSAITAATLLGYPLGPVLGGWLLSNFWWGSVFLINVPVAVVAVVAVAYLVPESRGDERRRLDVAGVILSGLGLAGVTYGLIEGGQKGWGQAGPLIGLAGGVLLLAGFVLYELRLASRLRGVPPLVDFKLFRSPGFTWGTLMATIVSFVMLGLLFVVPQYLQEVLGASTLGTGVRLLPVIGGLIVGAVVAIAIQRRLPQGRLISDTKTLVATGFLLLAGGAVVGMNTTISSGTGFAATWLVVGGVGLGFALPTAMNTAIGAVSQRESGAGASLIWVFRQVGGTFGVAILGTVLSSSYRGHLRNLGLPASVSARVDESITAGVAVAHRLGFQGLELLATARTGFVDAMDVVLGVCAAIAVAAAILVWVIPLGGRSRRGEQHTRVLTVAGRQDGGTLG